MIRFTANRVATAIPQLILLGLLVFLLVHLFPGSIVDDRLGEGATPESVAALESQLGIDEPLPTQLVNWFSNAAQGDLGTSLANGRSVTSELWDRVPTTLSITLMGMLIAFVVGLPAGVFSATRAGRWQDRSASILASIGLAIPGFWLGLILLQQLAIERSWFPAVGYTPFTENKLDWLKSIFLPGLALGLPAAALVARQARTALIEAFQKDYIRAARAKGLSKRRLVFKHAAKNAAGPVLIIASFVLTIMIGSAFVVEQVFALNGIGSYGLRSVLQKDLTAIQGFVMLVGVVVIVVNLLVDVGYAWLNPRIRPS